jgi:hypothetical protein
LLRASRDFAERNYERVVGYAGFYLLTIFGTLFLTRLFDVPADLALGAQLVLLGLPDKK